MFTFAVAAGKWLISNPWRLICIVLLIGMGFQHLHVASLKNEIVKAKELVADEKIISSNLNNELSSEKRQKEVYQTDVETKASTIAGLEIQVANCDKNTNRAIKDCQERLTACIRQKPPVYVSTKKGGANAPVGIDPEDSDSLVSRINARGMRDGKTQAKP